MKKSNAIILIALVGLLAAPLSAKESFVSQITHAPIFGSQKIPAEGNLEIAFLQRAVPPS